MSFAFPKSRIFERLPSSVRILPYVLAGFRCQAPREVNIELSNRCNLRCRMCWFYGEKGIGDRYRERELSTEEVCKVVDRLSRDRPKLYIGGTEPTIRGDFLKIVEHIKSHDLAVSFTTNGTLWDSTKIRTIVDLGVEAVNFSIDGPEVLHDRVRGEGVFRKAASAIRAFSEYKKLNGKTRPIIYVNITISTNIVGHLDQTTSELIEATHDGIDFFRIHHLWYITPDQLEAHQHVMKKTLNCCAPGASSHLICESGGMEGAAIAKEISSLSNKSNIRMFPDLDYVNIIKYYSCNEDSKKRCFAPFYGVLIKPNGDVKFCPDEWIDDYVLGNIRNDSLDNIWNNKKARRFRAQLWKRKSFPGCRRCNGMFSFPQR